MMWKHWLASTLTVALVAAPSAAVAQAAGQQQQPQPQKQGQQTPEQQQGVLRADRLIGQTIRDSGNDRLGRIEDLGLNIKDGRIAYVVVNRGGMWGMGGETVALPWQQLQPNQAERAVRLDKTQLQQARRIDTSRAWPAKIGDEPVGTTGAATQHAVVPVSNIIGMDVLNKQGEQLGRIDEVAIGRDGAVSYAVIAHGGFLGVGDKYVAVPWDRLTVDAQRETAVIDVARDRLDAAKAFDRDRWPARVDWPFGVGR